MDRLRWGLLVQALLIIALVLTSCASGGNEVAKEEEMVARAKDYLINVIRQYSATGDAETARRRYLLLEDEYGKEVADNILNSLVIDFENTDVMNDRGVSQLDIVNFYDKVVVKEDQQPSQKRETPTLKILLTTGCLLSFLSGIGLIVFPYLLRSGYLRRGKTRVKPVLTGKKVLNQKPKELIETEDEPVPADLLGEFNATYDVGNDLYFEKFTIEEDRRRIGECAVQVEEAGIKKDREQPAGQVYALKIWLFDPTDARTDTKILMSRATFEDEGTKSRLELKGEPLLLQQGGEFSLETISLELSCKSLEVKYLEGGVPPQSYFKRVKLRLRARKK